MTAPADLDLDALERALRKVETPQPGDAEMRDMLLVAVAELRAHRAREERLKPLVEACRANMNCTCAVRVCACCEAEHDLGVEYWNAINDEEPKR